MKFLERLNTEQKSAATAPQGLVRVLALAGTGKTTTLTSKIAHEIESGRNPKEILALTFTKKAGNELKDRLKKLVGDKANGLFAGTFHSFAHGYLSKLFTYTILKDDDIFDILKTITEDYQQLPYKIEDLIQTINLHRATLKPYSDPILEKIEKEYKSFKLQNNLKDFTDILADFLSLLEQDFFKFNYSLIAVDEAQDCNGLQNQITKQLIKHNKNLFLIGDGNQSIYQFNGADLASFYGWKNEGCVDYPLTFNYRSTNEVLKVANKVLCGIESPDKSDRLVLKNPKSDIDAPKAKLVKVGNIADECAYIVNKIREFKNQGQSLENTAILYRSHYYAQQLQIKLAEAGITTTVWSGQNILNAKHIQDVMAFLRVYINKKDVMAWSRIFSLMPKIGKKTAAQLAGSVNQKGVEGLDHPSLGPIKTIFQYNNQESFFRALEAFYLPYIRSEFPEDSRDIATGKFLDYIKRQEDIKKTISDMLFDEKKENETKGVTLTTVHSSKGLEWENVFVIGCMDGVFPHYKNEDVQEELRLFYVAVTRAKTNLFCMFPELNARNQKPGSLFYNLITGA